MGWIARLLGGVPKEEMAGIRLDTSGPYWSVSGAKEFPALFEALRDFLPPDAIVYLEGGSPSGELAEFLAAASIAEQAHVAYGTIWPKPRVVHVAATDENLARLAELAEHRAEPELAIHFHVYSGGQVLIEWHDAFDQPMLLSPCFSEDDVRRFCERLSMTYQRENGGPSA